MIAEHTRVLLGVSGGIAAYKACELVRRLKDQGCDVRVVLTENAARFVTATSFQALSGNSVRSSLWDEHAEAAMGHIELARWADLLLIAPASANTIAKLAHGLADDLLMTLVLASAAPLAIAPAMNQQMYAHASVQANLQTLRDRGVAILGPASGAQACGDVGAGRMLEVAEVIDALGALPNKRQNAQAPILAGKTVVITAGPTYEDIDPVRFIGNRSSGKMGFAIASAAQLAGAKVILVAGPTALLTPIGITRVDVRSAQQMLDATTKAVIDADLFIAAAAVADYRVAEIAAQKIKKSGQALHLDLVENPDIVGRIASNRPNPRLKVVGFAAETNDLLDNARAKLSRKNLDWIAANLVGHGKGMDADDNALVLISAEREVDLGSANKTALAARLIAELAQQLHLTPNEKTNRLSE